MGMCKMNIETDVFLYVFLKSDTNINYKRVLLLKNLIQIVYHATFY